MKKLNKGKNIKNIKDNFHNNQNSFKFGGIANVGVQATGDIMTGTNGSFAETKGYEDQFNQELNNIRSQSLNNLEFNSTSDIMNYNLSPVSYNELDSISNNKFFKDYIANGIKGAQVGSAAGPWGALIGAGVAQIKGGLFNWYNRNRNRRFNDKLASEANYINQLNRKVYDREIQDFKINQSMKELLNIAAMGGKLDIKDKDMNKENKLPDDFSNGVTVIKNGGTHENNPLGGVPQGIGENGKQNVVEEGEVKYNDYIFSNRIVADKLLLKQLGLTDKYEDSTYAYIADKLSKESNERPNDPISIRGLENTLGKLRVAQEMQKLKIEAKEKGITVQQLIQEKVNQAMEQSNTDQNNVNQTNEDNTENQNTFATGGDTTKGLKYDPNLGFMIPEITKEAPYINRKPYYLPVNYSNINSLVPNQLTTNLPTSQPSKLSDLNSALQTYVNKNSSNKLNTVTNNNKVNVGDLTSLLRYAPVLASMNALVSQQKPNYKYAKMAGEAGTTISPKINSTYSPFKALSTYEPMNKILANSQATDRNIINTSGGNRYAATAGLLSNAYNTNRAIGDVYNKAEEYNYNRLLDVIQRNNTLKQHESNLNFYADQYNSKLQQSRDMAKLGIMQQIDDAYNQAKTANLNNLTQNLYNIGEEAYTANQIKSNPAFYYDLNPFTGTQKYKKNRIKASK